MPAPYQAANGEPSPIHFIRPVWLLAAVLWLSACFALAWWQPPDAYRPDSNLHVPQLSLLQRLKYPIERNTWKRLPTIGADLVAVTFTADGQRGWATGTDGTIVATRNGGQTWAAQYSSDTPNIVYAIAIAADGQRGWAVGWLGTILATRDGGQTWRSQSSGTPSVLHGTTVTADGQRGWAVGDDGTITATRDGGQTWAAQSSGTQSALNGVAIAADGQRGWVVGDSGTILATRDGGQTWTAQSSGTESALNNLAIAADGQRGWVVGDSGTILATRDGGQTWAARSSGTQSRLSGVAFTADGQRGWVVGIFGTILATRDGGQTWATLSSGRRSSLNGVAVGADGRRGWVVGDSGLILATDDGGQTWGAQSSVPQSRLSGVAVAADGQRGWVVGDSGTLLATRDGGQTWSPESSGTEQWLYGVAVTADGERSWAVGGDGTIVATRDAGQTWAAQSSGTQSYLFAVAFAADGQRGWVVGNLGTILATRDGGQTWAAQSSGTQSWLSGVAVTADGQSGWAVGKSGTIIATRDGGQTWAAQSSGTQSWLSGVAFAADGQRGWVVGPAGMIVATRDGGQTWAAQSSGTQSWLSAVAFADGQRGCAVGDSGTIVATRDGGQTWAPHSSGTQANLYQVAFPANGQRGLTVGERTIATIDDDGQTWHANLVRYHRYPAPWFWFVAPLALLFVWRGFNGEGAAIDNSIDGIGTSDAAVGEFSGDRLEFAPLARGIARFLRNRNTSPPLTLAITGDWGSGKSSLMQLVCADLRAGGYRPVWFNAWHHQKEEQLLAALLQALQRYGLPSSVWPSGWMFRLRLLGIRSRKHLLLVWLLIAALVAVVAFWDTHTGEEWQKFWTWTAAKAHQATDVVSSMTHPTAAPPPDAARALSPIPSPPPTLPLSPLAQLAAVVTALVALSRGLKAFGTDPAVLFASMADGFRLKDASAQNNFRLQFAEQFSEVTRALPYRTVIAIDDLDRCKPKAVLEVMEAVNFLTSSGACFVLFGMATERVQAALAIAFERIAQELVVQQEGAPNEDKDAAARQKRRDYARDYLEKLINIEIKVPQREDVPPHALLMHDKQPRERRFLMRVWPLALIVSALLVGGWVGYALRTPEDRSAVVTTQPSTISPMAVRNRTGPSDSQPTTTASVEPKSAWFEAGDTRSISGWNFAGGFMALLIAAAVAAFYRLRAEWRRVDDSPVFERALKIWTPLVAARRNTPRAIKRFGNRVRYFAMLQQGETLDRPAWRDLIDWLRGRLGRPATSSGGAGSSSGTIEKTKVLSESRLIALSALFDGFGEQRWREVATQGGTIGLSLIAEHLWTALGEDSNAFGEYWPPSADELAIFDRLLAGIRMPGEVEVLRPQTATVAPAAAPDAMPSDDLGDEDDFDDLEIASVARKKKAAIKRRK